MKIVIAADHRGFSKKEALKEWLLSQERDVKDVGANDYNKDDDYVDYAVLAIENLRDGDRGILLCGSGHGMDIVANRFEGIRAVLGFNNKVVAQGREHEDANVLVLPAEWVGDDEVVERARIFINTPFGGEDRHVRRINKIDELDSKKHE